MAQQISVGFKGLPPLLSLGEAPGDFWFLIRFIQANADLALIF
jgi:hypothetical protein